MFNLMIFTLIFFKIKIKIGIAILALINNLLYQCKNMNKIVSIFISINI